MMTTRILIFFLFSILTFALSAASPNDELMEGLAKSDTAKIEEALKNGADLNVSDQKGITPLMQASIFGQTKSVQLLLDKGANPNLKDQNGNTALTKAAINDRTDIVKMLLAKGADPAVANNNGDDALSLCISKGAIATAKLIIKELPVLNMNTSVLAAIIRGNNEEIYKLFIEKIPPHDDPGSYLNTKTDFKLDSIIIEKFESSGLPVNKAVRELNSLAQKYDNSKEGVKIIIPMTPSELEIPHIKIIASRTSLRKILQELCSEANMNFAIQHGMIFLSYKNTSPDKSDSEKEEIMPFRSPADNKYGFINIDTGKIVIPAQFDTVRNSFRKGQCIVQKNKKLGIIDTKGNYILKPEYSAIRDIFESDNGLIQVNKDDSRVKFVDKKGNIVISSEFYKARGSFNKSGDCCAVLDNDTKLWGVIDSSGKFVIAPKFEWLYNFSSDPDALNIVKINGKWSIVNNKGDFVLNSDFDDLMPCGDYKLYPAMKDNKWGFIDKTAAVKIPFAFDQALAFSHGAAAVKKGNKWGFIDKHGNFILEPFLELRWPPSFTGDGFASFRTNNRRYAVIDMTGAIFIKPDFNWIGPFSDGNAMVMIGSNFFRIDRTGQIISKVYFTK